METPGDRSRRASWDAEYDEAGQLGSMVSDLYQNGTYLTEAMISGRSAGRNAVRRACAQ